MKIHEVTTVDISANGEPGDEHMSFLGFDFNAALKAKEEALLIYSQMSISIKEARERAGLSRAEMSRRFEIPVRTIEEWEADRRTPPIYVEKLIIEKLEALSK